MRMKKFTDICETHKNFMKNVKIEQDFLFQKGSFYSFLEIRNFITLVLIENYFISDVTMI